MELFKRRPMCVCCGLFLLFSYLCAHLAFTEKIYIALISLAAIVLLLLARAIFKIRSYGFLSLIMCFVFILGALVNNFLRIDIPHESAQRYVGEHNATMEIVYNEHYSEHSAAYVVDVTTVDGEKTSVRAVLVLGFGAEVLYVGDTVYADVDFYEMDARIMGQTGYARTDRQDVSLTAALYESENVSVRRFDRDAGFFKKLFLKNGFSVILDDMRKVIEARLDKCLGDDVGAAANAYLTGNKSGLSVDTIRDYRRAGISHLFAVSGLHVSILLGAVERLLKKLCCRKTTRCLLLSACALILLLLTGFSMSAMRSVFMLFMVYIAFLTSEENDSPTSLFLAVVIIILITPYAIYELGMWMSFLATLGVVTVYPLVQRSGMGIKGKSKAAKALRSILHSCLLTIVGTVSATMFLLPVSWAIFGEMSIVGIPANVIISPLATVFLIFSALAALFCNVPVINFLIRCVATGVSYLMTSLTAFFSSFDMSVVSLRYPFAKWVVVIFSLILVLMLLIKITKKIYFLIPPIAFAASFIVGVLCFNITNPTALRYTGNGHREVISVFNDESFAIVDMSDGAYSRFYDAYEEASVYGATQVESIVLTAISPAHVSSLDYFLRNNVVKTLYLPQPYSEDSREMLIELTTIAEASGVHVSIYNCDSMFEICDDVDARVICSANGDKRSVAVFVAESEEIFGYADAFVDGSELESRAGALIKRCETLIVGNNGLPDGEFSFEVGSSAKVIYCSEALMRKSNIQSDPSKTYFNTRKVFDFRIPID